MFAIACLTLAAGASAATINVPGNNGKSIQDGVDQADPGDTVAIKKKQNSYFENVVVTTNRITLKGVKGRPVIDGTSPDGGTDGLSLDITARRVSVVNIASRHGNGLECTGNRCRFEKVAVSMSDQSGDCILIDGNASLVKDSNLLGCDSEAIEIDGDGGRILDNSMRQADGGCVDIDGDRPKVIGNTIRNCEDDDGISFSGNDAQIRGNKIASTDGVGVDVDGHDNQIKNNVARDHADDESFEVDGNRNRIEGNRAIHTAGSICFNVDGIRNVVKQNRAQFCSGGFEVDGENMKVIGNRSVNSPDDEGFDVGCFDETGGADLADACKDAVVQSNFASDNGDDDEGYQISDDSTDGGMAITGNVSEDNNDGGFDIETDDARIANNVSRRDGAEGNEPGIEIDGDGNVVETNRVSVSGDDGINVDGDDNDVIANTVTRSNIDGIEIDGGLDNLLRRNVTTNNFGDGIENDGTDTDVVKNVSRGNRRNGDCVNDGTIDLKQGNRCADGSNFNEPGTVDRVRPRR